MEHVSTTKTCQNSECVPRDNVTVSKVYMHLYVGQESVFNKV